MACRSMERGQAAKKRIALRLKQSEEDFSRRITVLRLDLSSLDSVKSFVEEY